MPDEESDEIVDDKLDLLEKRIEELKEPKRGNRQFTRGVALATTLGFVLVGCILAGYQLGNYLKQRYDSEFFFVLSLLGGLGIAFYAGFRLVQPFLAEDENDSG